jgi:hypothetical protein
MENELVRSWVDRAARVVMLTGAGISTESGIADFRGPQGVWTKNPRAEKQDSVWISDPTVVAHRIRLVDRFPDAHPMGASTQAIPCRTTLQEPFCTRDEGLNQPEINNPGISLPSVMDPLCVPWPNPFTFQRLRQWRDPRA